MSLRHCSDCWRGSHSIPMSLTICSWTNAACCRVKFLFRSCNASHRSIRLHRRYYSTRSICRSRWFSDDLPFLVYSPKNVFLFHTVRVQRWAAEYEIHTGHNVGRKWFVRRTHIRFDSSHSTWQTAWKTEEMHTMRCLHEFTQRRTNGGYARMGTAMGLRLSMRRFLAITRLNRFPMHNNETFVKQFSTLKHRMELEKWE